MNLTSTETNIVRSCLDWLALHGIKAWRSNNTGVYDPTKKIFRTFHGLKGVADIIGVFPQTVRLEDGAEVTFGNILCVEVKKPGEKLRPDQAAFLQQIRELGGIGICVHSLSELEEKMQPFRCM